LKLTIEAVRQLKMEGNMETKDQTMTSVKVAETLLEGKSILFGGDKLAQINVVLDKKEFSLEELYKIIGCKMVEYVPLTVGNLNGKGCIWCDEEGMINKSAINKSASEVLGNQVHGGVLFGTILVTCHPEE